MTSDELFTIMDLYIKNQRQFPFWASNWNPVHSIVSVRDYGYLVPDPNNSRKQLFRPLDLDDELNLSVDTVFKCDRYTVDKKILIRKGLYIAAHNTKSWLPA